MHNNEQINTVDEICQHLSMAYLLTDREQPDAHRKYVEAELDGLYELAKIILPIARQNPTMLRAAELLLQSIGLQIKHPPPPQFQIGKGPHIFVANHPGCGLIDGAIGARTIARLGLKPSIIGVKNMNVGADEDQFISVEYPRIQNMDPRKDSDIAAANAKSLLRIRTTLARGCGLLLFPGAGLYRSCREGRVLVDKSFDRLAPVLLACQGLQAKLHLIHFDYELPSWRTRLHDRDRAKFYATQFKAVLSLRRQVATVKHLKSVTVEPDLNKQERLGLCRQLHELAMAETVSASQEREVLLA